MTKQKGGKKGGGEKGKKKDGGASSNMMLIVLAVGVAVGAVVYFHRFVACNRFLCVCHPLSLVCQLTLLLFFPVGTPPMLSSSSSSSGSSGATATTTKSSAPAKASTTKKLMAPPRQSAPAAPAIVPPRVGFEAAKDRTFLEWLVHNGAILADGVVLREGSRGRGIFMDKPYVEGNALYQVPDRVWFSEKTITRSTAKFSQVLKDHRSLQPNSDPHPVYGDGPAQFQSMLQTDGLNTVKLAFALDAERFHADSFYAPYINTLPTAYSSQPLFWSDEMLEEQLHSPLICSSVRESIRFLAAQHETHMPYLVARYPHLYNLEVNTVQTFIWAYYSFKSRAFDISTTEEIVLGAVLGVALATVGLVACSRMP
jgi:hypothetical protein